MPSIILKPGKDRRITMGHPWVYAGEVAKITGDPADGDAVEIRDHKERFFGRGLLNTKSQIVVRRFSTEKDEIDKDFFRRRLATALAHRQTVLAADSDAYRVVFSEADQMPGLILDRYGDHLVLQALTLGIDQRKSWIIEIAQRLLSPKAVIERSDVHTRKLEGLEEQKGVLAGETDGLVEIKLAGVKFEADLLADQKTGLYLDQADNYREVARFAAGRRVLDCFSSQGGFSLTAAAHGAKSVEAIEISEASVGRARRNTEINNLTGHIEFVCANAFDVLKHYDGEKRTYDMIILDPPSFTRSKQNVGDALRGYKEINLRALKMLPVGGILATFTCSHHITSELFRAVVVEAAADAHKTIRLVNVLSQSADHPILPAVPETEYLKGFLLQVI